MAWTEAVLGRLEQSGVLRAANLSARGESLATDRALADERETIALMRRGDGRGVAPMRGRAVDKTPRNGPSPRGSEKPSRSPCSAGYGRSPRSGASRSAASPLRPRPR